MSAPLVGLLLLAASFMAPSMALIRHVTVPHNAKEGHVIASLVYWGQDYFFHDKSDIAHDLQIPDVFSVLSNGNLVTNQDLSQRLGEKYSVVVVSELPTQSWKEVLHVEVTNEEREYIVFVYKKYIGHILENQAATSVVSGLDDLFVLPYRKDDRIRFSLEHSHVERELFSLHQYSDKTVQILTKEPLDREERIKYSLKIKACVEPCQLTNQTAFADIDIIVDDMNDNIPHFSHSDYFTTVSDSLPLHSTVYSVHALDPDEGSLTYSIQNASPYFSIDSQRGHVVLTDSPLKSPYYDLSIVATDTGNQKSSPVVLHISVDGVLRFTPDYKRRNKRDLRPAKEVQIKESYTNMALLDILNDNYDRFTLKEPAPPMLDIGFSTGTVRLREGHKLDYETQPEIEFTVIISRSNDASFRAEQRVKVVLEDVNDEYPVFINTPRPFLATVSANAAPGTSVYQLLASDADRYSDVQYNLESGGEDRFQVDPHTGIVRTLGSASFPLGKEYEIGVSALDANANTLQKSPTHSLKILVGPRNPQFFESLYTVNVPEDSVVGYRVIKMEALSFQRYPISYFLTTDSGTPSNEFAINTDTGVVDLLRKLDYEKDPDQYYLRVDAVENGRPERSSTVMMVVNLVDENDNSPTFPLSQYIKRGIAETTTPGMDVIQVTATDLDSVTNAQLTYSVTDANFTVQSFNNIGYIKTARRLDYDFIPNHTYNFTIVATDNGTPPRNGSATVRVGVTNVNDEDPLFRQRVEHVQVSEDAQNTVVHVLQAYDPDGDGVSFSFQGGRDTEGPFRIDSNSGIITLEHRLDRDTVSYTLTVVATDNGRCCGGMTHRSSEGLVVVEVKDVNNNAPKFPHCNEYNPTVFERDRVGTSVIRVEAQDPDRGKNGNITYSVVKSNDQSFDRFSIEPFSGILKTADVFDREAKTGVTDYGVTIKAEDQGSPSLAGFCTFRVKIGDRNDNPPVFDLPFYETSLEEGSIIGKKVLQVYATDKDAGDNGKVQYGIVQDSSRGFFRIESNTGWIKVASAMSGTDQVNLVVEARDKGQPPRQSEVTVQLHITQTVNAYPQWVQDYSLTPIRLSENDPRDFIVARLKAMSTQPDSPYVNYVIQAGETPEQNGPPKSFHSRIDEATNEMLLMVYRPLDYEITPTYTLTIKAANRATNSLHNDTRITIELIDENDEIPMFVGLNENGRYSGSVAENSEPGTEVIRVTATDRDAEEAYSKVTYRLKEIYDWEKFSIHRETGIIVTTSTFDREKKSEYYVMVVAEDGARSDRPNHYPPGTPNQGEVEVQIRVTDMNDERPYFRDHIYTASVPENTDSGSVIMTVTAEDNDEENRLTYSITSGNNGGAFEVVSELGEIKVRGQLDFEDGPREYRLRYRVFDDKFDNETTVVVYVTDVNDNPPKFQYDVYNVTDIMEEEQGISVDNPKYLLTVRASDPDKDRDGTIRYALTGQFADDGTFKINPYTGEITMTRALDRDEPNGRPVWNFNVLAYDEPGTEQSLTGYAEVRVMPKDINDNAPVFNRNFLVGHVPEHSEQGIPVMTVMAEDKDAGNNGSIIYSLKQVPMSEDTRTPLFTIDSESGLISTKTSEALDRERKAIYDTVIVQARDKGRPNPQSSSATVTIMVEDINDHAPKFTQKIFRTSMSESLGAGASITSVSATDEDVGQYAKLTYSLKQEDREFFSMVSVEPTNTGVLKVFRPVDYDSLSKQPFNLTVYVRDDNPDHVDEAYIELYVSDYNDNAPVFLPNMQSVSIFENVTRATTLARFRATDSDSNENRLFEYSISRESDPHRLFTISRNGLVTVAGELDREGDQGANFRVHILAIDKGQPPMTGTGTLSVTLMDVNDNYPTFAEDYRPVVYENEPAGQLVAEISAMDRDTFNNGPPFEFWTPCGGGCPCQENPVCGSFDFQFIPEGGRNGYGTGIIKSLKTFDREERREYLMPIVMKDGGKPPNSGTNTLTITIGDRNDNEHYAAHKNVHVYNYRGEFRGVYLGVVPTRDKDDWDVVNKTFSFIDEDTKRQFSLNNETGQLHTMGTINEGVYHFKVDVTDHKWGKTVTSSVTVTVQEIGDDAVFSSGSLRLTDITAEEFVARESESGISKISYYDKFRALLASKLSIPVLHVDIFTVMNHPTQPRTVDIRFAAHNSPFYRPVRLNGVIDRDRHLFEDLGLHIAMVPIDECMSESCESGGCSNTLTTTGEPLVVNTNGTAMVGVTAYITAECACAARKFGEDNGECKPDSCLNGGTCTEREYDFVCECKPGFDGPRCQQTVHSFYGHGWAWYKPLAQCQDSHTSLEFITQRNKGVLFYNGPTQAENGWESDYILLQLHQGYPVLRINHGSGEAQLTLNGRDQSGDVRLQPLNDGEWHRIDIFRIGKSVRMVVDQCKAARIEESENRQTTAQDRTPCETEGVTPGDNQFLNVHQPLQLGGRSNTSVDYPRNVMKHGFHGCIKNFMHDGELYDLHMGRVGQQHGSRDGCAEEQAHCVELDGSAKCGSRGQCIGSLMSATHTCVCPPGWRQPKCSIPTTTKDFRGRSFIEWDFKDEFYRNHVDKQRDLTDLQLMFRTRQLGGLLMLAQNAHKSEYIKLEIHDYRLHFRYNLGRGEQTLSLSHVNASDGQWHSAHVERVGRWVILRLDGGEGSKYNYTLGTEVEHQNIRVSQRSLQVGGDVRFSSTNDVVLVNDDYRDSCMNDVRYNGVWLPMDESQNDESDAADVIRSGNLQEGCESSVCHYSYCPHPFVCADLWRHSECRCPRGQLLTLSGVCEAIDECAGDPCEHGRCIDTEHGFRCDCYDDYQGLLCQAALSKAVSVDMSVGALVIIFICALVTLSDSVVLVILSVYDMVIILLVIIYTRRRKPDQYALAVDPYDDVRENIMHYDEEGVGEEDQDAYDINRLKKPIEEPPPIRKPVPPTYAKPVRRTLPKDAAPAEMASFIKDRIADIEQDPTFPPHDSVREYAYEGGGSDAGSLSSLASTSDPHDQDWSHLNNWGPRFSKLANMYGDHPH